MNNLRFRKITLITFMLMFCTFSAFTKPKGKLSFDRWTYIQVDSTRGKWGDFAPPDWLAYFGLSASDVNGDGYLDIIAGRYFYINPGGDMTGHWDRVDLGLNVDAILFVDVDGDKFADCIAEALPDVYWMEADAQGKSWHATKIATIPASQHVNGQGFKLAQIVPGGRTEIVLSTGKGIYYLEIPAHPEAGNWPSTQAAQEATEQGLGVGDVDGDGLIDIAASYGGDGESSKMIAWWKNPGDKTAKWKLNKLGMTENYSADRLAVADMNADGRADILVTEESWQTEDPVVQLFLFSQGVSRGIPSWKRKSILTSGSLNSLDIADIDNDGDPDFVTGEHKGKNKRVFLLENDGKANFTTHVIDNSNKENHLGTLLFDMDGDGDPDILSVAWNNYQFLHLWRNDAIAKPLYKKKKTNDKR